MSTMNISLPADHVTLVDRLVVQQGFANRSEFFRALIRLISRKPQIISDASIFPFDSTPQNQSVREMMADFRATKKYSKAFLKDLEDGLNESSYCKP